MLPGTHMPIRSVSMGVWLKFGRRAVRPHGMPLFLRRNNQEFGDSKMSVKATTQVTTSAALHSAASRAVSDLSDALDHAVSAGDSYLVTLFGDVDIAAVKLARRCAAHMVKASKLQGQSQQNILNVIRAIEESGTGEKDMAGALARASRAQLTAVADSAREARKAKSDRDKALTAQLKDPTLTSEERHNALDVIDGISEETARVSLSAACKAFDIALSKAWSAGVDKGYMIASIDSLR